MIAGKKLEGPIVVNNFLWDGPKKVICHRCGSDFFLIKNKQVDIMIGPEIIAADVESYLATFGIGDLVCAICGTEYIPRL